MICRLCGTDDLVTVLELGDQARTGAFPMPGEPVPRGPLTLMRCPACTLVQLGESFAPAEMYGVSYGYRSGLNRSMVEHLERKAQGLEALVGLNQDDVVLDIGSNDGTLLKAYTTNPSRIGIDPLAKQFLRYYGDIETVVPDFFSAGKFWEVSEHPARIITSIACFYDLENPVAFAKDVRDCLAPDGVWHLEQSYLPAMLRANAYDTVCHEHLEYYSLTTIKRILEEADLQVVDVRFNQINGGSFAVTASHRGSPLFRPAWSHISDVLRNEQEWLRLDTRWPFDEFKQRVFHHRNELVGLIDDLRANGKTIMGYGASTKGNVLLQFCGFGPTDIQAIAEVNEEKYGHVTPGTNIPIVPEAVMRAVQPDYLLVLPWHFRDSIIEREHEYLAAGGKLIFPLPKIEIVG